MLAIYPGTFDPITNGHVHIALKARKIFGNLTLAVPLFSSKNNLFTAPERVQMIKECFESLGADIGVELFSGLYVDFIKSKGSDVITVRGIRNHKDFNYEFELHFYNKEIHDKFETVFIVSDKDFSSVSSTFVRELKSYGKSASYSRFVPENVAKRLSRI